MAVNAETIERGPTQEGVSPPTESGGSNWFRSVSGQASPAGGDATEPGSNVEQTEGSESPSTTRTGDTPESTESLKAGDSPDDSSPKPRSFTVTEDQLETAFQKRLQSELDGDTFNRRVQAEVDRRKEIDRRRDRAEERRRLRDEDPIAFLEKDKEWEAEDHAAIDRRARELEEQRQVTTVIQNTAAAFDKEIITPIMLALPATDRAELDKIPVNGNTLQHRQTLVKAALDRLVKNAETRAETRLRNSDAFRKQLLLELRGQEDEPDFVEGTSVPPRGPGWDFNSEIRNLTGRGVRRRR